MDTPEQIRQFGEEIDKVVDRFRKEYDLPYAAAIGVLQLKTTTLTLEAIENEIDDES